MRQSVPDDGSCNRKRSTAGRTQLVKFLEHGSTQRWSIIAGLNPDCLAAMTRRRRSSIKLYTFCTRGRGTDKHGTDGQTDTQIDGQTSSAMRNAAV